VKVDPDDDTIQRYVAWHYRYDPDRRCRRNVVVAAFDDAAEFESFIRESSEALHRRKAHGDAETVEHVGGVVLPAGYREAMRRGRGESQALKGVEHWRRVLGHEGYFVADLRLNTPEEGGGKRPLQGGYSAQWWLVVDSGERWLGPGGIDLLGEQRRIKPGETGQAAIYPWWPAYWQRSRARASFGCARARGRERSALPRLRNGSTCRTMRRFGFQMAAHGRRREGCAG